MNTHLIEQRRKDLGMPLSALAARSGIPLSTLKRMLKGGLERASLCKVSAVAAALGLSMSFQPLADSLDFREQQARKKARRIVELVQGSSALESQAVDQGEYDRMVRQTTHELVAGSKRRLWAT